MIDKELYPQIVDDYNAGMSRIALSKKYKTSTTTIRRILELNGIKFSGYMSEELKFEIYEFRMKGWKYVDLAKKFGVSIGSITNAIDFAEKENMMREKAEQEMREMEFINSCKRYIRTPKLKTWTDPRTKKTWLDVTDFVAGV